MTQTAHTCWLRLYFFKQFWYVDAFVDMLMCATPFFVMLTILPEGLFCLRFCVRCKLIVILQYVVAVYMYTVRYQTTELYCIADVI